MRPKTEKDRRPPIKKSLWDLEARRRCPESKKKTQSTSPRVEKKKRHGRGVRKPVTTVIKKKNGRVSTFTVGWGKRWNF